MQIKNHLMSARGLALAVACAAVFIPALAVAGEAAGTTEVNLKRVETKKVCMITNKVFEKDQIPVRVEGRTYYGCCEMCKERLAKDPGARAAVDPVTGKKVDKATAWVAASPDGSVLYFESEASFKRHVARTKAGPR